MNPNYTKKVKEEIEKLLKFGFIYMVDKVTWISPILIAPKNNGALWVCFDHKKLNVTTVTIPFPIPFIDAMLDIIVVCELYCFLDGFNGYN